MRVYVTLNTTLYPGELTALAEAVAGIAAAGADAVITQDLAVAALVRRLAPGLALHGSTQMLSLIHICRGRLCGRRRLSQKPA